HRKALGLTQTELGEKLGVKTNAVSKWECGRVDDIPTSKIKAMAKLFDVQPSYLIAKNSRPHE
ncbi:transcriptional repressor, partial [human gut metagenome]